MTQQLLAAQDSVVGSVLLGRYRVVRELARGGMGVVYLARAEGAVGFVKPVVVKLLLPEHTEDEHIVRMFAREARILSQLRHPSLVDVIEFGEQDGGYVLVLEYVRGYHLGLWLRYLALKKRAVSAPVVLQLMVDVLEALHHAHTQLHPDGTSMQIVHRDVSPSNILLDETGRGRLLDFGVARMRGGGTQDYRTQVQGGFMGKLPYTAPEVFSGSEASVSSDLYACAVVLHEALYGQNVFRAETQAATLQRVLSHVPEALEPVLTGIPAGLDAVLARALAKNPASRHADARELASDLRRLLTDNESDIHARLAELLKDDFGVEMSQLLKLESLADRDAAWRRASETSVRRDTATRRPGRDESTGVSEPEPGLPNQPAPIGATVAASRGGRGSARASLRRTQPGLSAAPLVSIPANANAAPEPPVVLNNADARDSDPDALRPTHPVQRVQPQPASALDNAEEDARSTRPPRPPRPATEAVARESSHVTASRARVSGAPRVPGPRPDATVPRGVEPQVEGAARSEQPEPLTPSVRPSPWFFALAALLVITGIAAAWFSGKKGVREIPAVHIATRPQPLTPPAAALPVAPADATSPTRSNEPTHASEPSGEPSSVAQPDKRPRRSGPDANALTRAVRKQQPKLEACFKEHSLSLEGQPTTQLMFDLAERGTVAKVELSPSKLATTSLGQCLLRVARSTPFPPQPRAVSFSIPITASTSRGG
ncbi:MAG: protein kinase [Polyangiales bacterium]